MRVKVKFSDINYLMSYAVDLATQAENLGEVPVGAVITDKAGRILAKTHNTKEYTNNACNHAEILAIKEASENLRSWRLVDCNLYVTLEPCPMCMSAISQARIKNVYFGAYDIKGGAVSLGKSLHNDKRLNHKVNVFGGFKNIECSKQISNFFRRKRKTYSTTN
jgi:tRNA(adenine34) deaminase